MATILKRNLVFGPAADRHGLQATGPGLAEDFHENTKLHRDAPVGGKFPTAYTLAETEAMVGAGRRYTSASQIALPPPETWPDSGQSLEAIIGARRTRRAFGEAPLPLAALSRALHLTAGVTGTQPTAHGATRALRAAPSAGALYPVELYLAVRHVEGLKPGLYHYQPHGHVLSLLQTGEQDEALKEACYYHDSLLTCGVALFFCGVVQRTVRKYGERGYRYMWLDAGHMAQNLCLSATEMNLACMTLCGFYDDLVHDLFRLDGVDEIALYLAYLGTAPEEAP